MAGSPDIRIGDALVDFSLSNTFPEEPLSSAVVNVADLAPALKSLAAAKKKLESEIHEINEETAPDVSQWVANAKSVEDDINRSRSLANEIVRRSEAPAASGQTILEAEEKVAFLRRESAYNQQVHSALTNIKHVTKLLDQVEQARDERRILDSLRLLESAWNAIDAIPVSKSCRAMKLLDMRAFELKSAVHDVFDHVWNALVRVDVDHHEISIVNSREGEQMSLTDAVIGIKAYKEIDQRMALLWHGLDQAIIGPRTHLSLSDSPRIQVGDNDTLILGGRTDNNVPNLITDLEVVMKYLSEKLPEELISALSTVMMPDLVPKIVTVWLDSAVPASLQDMTEFQDAIRSVKQLCESLRSFGFSGFEDLQNWAKDAHKIWLAKCREEALGSLRSKLSQGLGQPRQVERVETQTVSQSEGKELAANNGISTGEEDAWDAAWSDGGNEPNDKKPSEPAENHDDGADAWGWDDEDEAEGSAKATASEEATSATEEDDDAAAWGWGDEDTTTEVPPEKTPASAAPTKAHAPGTRELTLKETYNITSMPEPVLALISTILEDGASLVSAQDNPVAAAAAGMFSLPTYVLAMFRAVSPYYYALNDGGNMYLYNDATYLSERVADFASNWKTREDLAPRAVTMLRLDNDVKTLQSFAARAYSAEMATQRTIIRDLIGGAQNLLQQDGLGLSDMEAQVDNATARLRAVAATWSGILARSAWAQAVGSLVDALAAKLVADVMDLAGIGQDEAYNIASLIARIEQLDDLFLPQQRREGQEDMANTEGAIPETAQYAANWLRLKYLSEVLQSNLQEVLYLWAESELSLEFSVDEVVDLIRLSFVDNNRTRDVIRDIRANPDPRGVGLGAAA